jgi:hypothetical protein
LRIGRRPSVSSWRGRTTASPCASERFGAAVGRTQSSSAAAGASGLRDMTSPARKDRSPQASLAAAAAPRPRETLTTPVRLAIGRRRPRRRDSTTPASPKVASELMGHRTRKYQPGPAAITLGRYTHTLPAELARVAICSTRSSPSALARTRLRADAEFSFPPAFPRRIGSAFQAGLHLHISRSSKPAGRGSPALGRFDSFAAPL